MALVTIVPFPLPFPEAGLVSPECPEQLLIALEPEAASIYCRKLRLHQVIDLSLQPIMNGLDLDGAQPFDSGFRQGSEGWWGRRESGFRLFDGCFVLLRSVPGNSCGVSALAGGWGWGWGGYILWRTGCLSVVWPFRVFSSRILCVATNWH